MATERLNVKPPPGFDPNNKAHIQAVLDKVAQSSKEQGAGWQMQSYNAEENVLTLQRQSAVIQVKSGGRRDSYEVALMAGTKPTDGERIAAQLENDPQHAGYFLTKFEPHIGTATMARMTLDARTVRGGIAVVLGVKPWDVQVAPRRGGGFTVGLPPQYVPSKHNEKLQEQAEIVGKLGWYWTANAAKRIGEIVPAEPPLFPAIAPYPMELLPHPSPGVIAPLPLGLALADHGDEENPVAFLNFDQGPHLQLGGTTSSGKSVLLNVIIAGALGAGAELVICDVPQKAVDFERWRPYVRPGGWGAMSFEENAVALQELYKEGELRAEVFSRYGAKKLADLPEDIRKTMPPVLVIIDEYTGLLAKATVPKALPDDHPLRMEAETKNLAIDLLSGYVDKLCAEMRFVGIQVVVSTQVASTSTGIGTALRTNLTNKLLLGPRATDGNRKLVFRDPGSVPQVPEHIKEDGKMSRGVGAAELEGQAPFVLKGFFATEDDLIAELNRRGRQPIPDGQLDSATRPDPSVVGELFPQFAELREVKRAAKEPKYGTKPRKVEDMEAWELDPETGKPLSGFARANAAKHAATVNAKSA